MKDTEDQDMERVQNAINQLSEHFDAVQIFASRHEAEIEDGTISLNLGSGNWFARYGQVRNWIIKQEERDKEVIRKEE